MKGEVTPGAALGSSPDVNHSFVVGMDYVLADFIYEGEYFVWANKNSLRLI